MSIKVSVYSNNFVPMFGIWWVYICGVLSYLCGLVSGKSTRNGSQRIKLMAQRSNDVAQVQGWMIQSTYNIKQSYFEYLTVCHERI